MIDIKRLKESMNSSAAKRNSATTVADTAANKTGRGIDISRLKESMNNSEYFRNKKRSELGALISNVGNTYGSASHYYKKISAEGADSLNPKDNIIGSHDRYDFGSAISQASDALGRLKADKALYSDEEYKKYSDYLNNIIYNIRNMKTFNQNKFDYDNTVAPVFQQYDSVSEKYDNGEYISPDVTDDIKQNADAAKKLGVSSGDIAERLTAIGSGSAGLSEFYKQFADEHEYARYVKDMSDSALTVDEVQKKLDELRQTKVTKDGNDSKALNYLTMLVSGFAASPTESADIADNSRDNIANINDKESEIAYYTMLLNKKKVEELPSADLVLFKKYAENKDSYESDSLGRIVSAASGGTSAGTTSSLEVEQARQALVEKGYSDDDINTYLAYHENQKTEEFTKQVQADIDKHPVLMGTAYTAANVAMAPGRGIAALFGVNDLNNMSGAARGVVSEKIKKSVTEAGGSEGLATLASWGYSAVASSAESLLVMSMGPIGEVLLGLNAGTEAFNNAQQRGLSTGAAFATGVLSGAAEAIFEHISLDKLRAFAQSGKKSVGTYVTNILKQFITEGSEEVSTDIANALTDYLVNGGASEMAMNISAYIDSGYSETEARNMALKEFGEQLTESFVVGGLSGGMSAVAATGIGTVGGEIQKSADYETLGKFVQSADAGLNNLIAMSRPLVLEDKKVANMLTDVLTDMKSGKINSETVGRLYERVINQSEIKRYSEIGKQLIDDDSYNEMLMEAVKLPEGSGVREAAMELVESRKRKKNPADESFAEDYGRLSEMLDEYKAEKAQTERQNKVKEAVIDETAQRFTERGIDKNSAQEKASAAIAQLSGEELSKAQQKLLEDEQSKSIVDELESESVSDLQSRIQKRVRSDLGEGFAATERSADGNVGLSIVDIQKSEDGTVDYIAKDDSGAEMRYSADEFTFDDEDAETVFKYAARAFSDGVAESDTSQLGTKGVQALVYSYHAGMNGDTYISEFMDAYNAGITGFTFEKYAAINGRGSFGGIGEETARAALNAGLAERTYKHGVTRMGTKAELPARTIAEMRVLDEFGEKHQLSFIIVDTLGSDNAMFLGENRIVLALDNEQGLLTAAAGHEVFHYLEKTAPESAKYLTEFVINSLKNTSEYDYNARVAELKMLYGTSDMRIIESEITANSMFEVLSHSIDTETMPNGLRKVVKKIAKALRNFIDEIKAIIASSTYAEVAAFREQTDNLNAIHSLFEYALAEADKARGIENQTEETSEDAVKNDEMRGETETETDTGTSAETDAETEALETVKYSRKQFLPEIDRLEDEKYRNEYFEKSYDLALEGIDMLRQLDEAEKEQHAEKMRRYAEEKRSQSINYADNDLSDAESALVYGRQINSLPATESNKAIKEATLELAGEKRTGGLEVNDKTVGRIAREIIKGYSSKYDVNFLKKELASVFKYLASPRCDNEVAMASLTRIATEILEATEIVDDDLYNSYADFRDFFRTSKYTISDDVRSFLYEEYGGAAKFYRACMGKLVILKSENVSNPRNSLLSANYDEAFEHWPELLKDDSGDGQPDEYHMVQTILRAWNTIQPVRSGLKGTDIESAAPMLAAEMMQKWIEAPKLVTIGDRMQKRLGEVVAEMQQNRDEMLREQRERYEAALAEANDMREAEVNAYQGKVDDQWRKAKLSADKRVETQRKYFEERDKMRREALERKKENEETALKKKQILKKTENLIEMLYKPKKNGKSIPNFLTETVADFIASIDFSKSDRRSYKIMESMGRYKAVRQTPLQARYGLYTVIDYIDEKQTKAEVQAALEEYALNESNRISGTAYNLKWVANMEKIQQTLTGIAEKGYLEEGQDRYFFDIPPQLVQSLKEFIPSTKKENGVPMRIEELDGEQIRSLHYIVNLLYGTIANMNKMHASFRQESIDTVAKNFINDLKATGKVSRYEHGGNLTNKLGGFMKYDLIDSYTFADSLGSTGGTIIKSLQDGLDKQVDMMRIVQHFYQTEINGKYDVNEWKKETHPFSVEDKFGKHEITMTVPQIMSFYLTQIRENEKYKDKENGSGHIKGYGIVVSNALDEAMKEKKKPKEWLKMSKTDREMWREARDKAIENQIEPTFIGTGLERSGEFGRISETAIINSLSAEQIECAEKLQKFVADECAKWGNEYTREMWMYDAFGERKYWPIQSSREYLRTSDVTENDASLYALTNQGFTKQTVDYADNTIVIDDCFNVFSKHCAGMISLNAYGAACTDAMKLLNYGEQTAGEDDDGNIRKEVKSVKAAMQTALGKGSVDYYLNLLRDVQGVQSKAVSTDIQNALIGYFKGNAVGYNLSVVIQQPTAYLRAYALLDLKYLSMPKLSKLNNALMNRYSGIAQWKSWGFFEPGLGGDINDILIGNDAGWKTKARDFGMKGAQAADELTWAAIWGACERELVNKNAEYKNLLQLDSDILRRINIMLTADRNSEEYINAEKELNEKGWDDDAVEAKAAELDSFYMAVGKRMSDVVNKTQVVDSVFHRTQAMRSKDSGIKQATAFMSEPLKSYNMFYRAVQSGNKKAIARAAAAFAFSNLACAIAKSFITAARDDDEKKKYFEKYMKALAANLIDGLLPINMIPYANKIIPALEGFDGTDMTSEVITRLVTNTTDALEELVNFVNGNGSFYSIIYSLATIFSTFSGIGLNNTVKSIKNGINLIAPLIFQDKIDYDFTAGEIYNRMLEAYNGGNAEQFGKWADNLENKTTDDILSGFGAYLRKNEPLVADAGVARDNGDIDAYTEALNSLIGKLSAVYDGKTAMQTAITAVEGWQGSVMSYAKKLKESDAGSEDYTDAYEALEDFGLTEEQIQEYVSTVKSGETTDKEEKLQYNGKDIVNALGSGNVESAQKIVDYLFENGKNESGIKSTVSGEYKSIYLTAFEQGDKAGMNNVSELLMKLKGNDNEALYDGDTFTEWIKNGYKEQYYEAYKAGNTQETQRLLSLLNVLGTSVKNDILTSWQNGYKKWLENNR